MKRFLTLLAAIVILGSVTAQNQAVRIALLTDLHITPGNENDKMMPQIVKDINGEKFDLVVVAGDLTNMGSDDELSCAYNHLKGIKHRQIVTHGNHETTWSNSGGKDFEKYWGHNGCTTTRVGGYLFIAYPAGPFIKMANGTAQDGNRLAWVEKQLQKGAKQGIISICHYPLNNDVTNRTEIVNLLKKYNVSASLCGHYHKPRMMSFDSLPGILGRSLILKKGKQKTYGYTVMTLQNDSIYVGEKLIGKPATKQYTIAQRNDSTINTLRCDPLPEQLYDGEFKAEQVITDNAAIYTAVQYADNMLYYGNSAGEMKAYDIQTKKYVWCRKMGDPLYSNPIIYNELIIVPTLSKGLVALNRKSGRRVWNNLDGNSYIGNGVIDGDYLYIGTLGTMRKIDCKTGKTIWTFSFSTQHPQGRPSVHEGKLVFGAWDKYLYCVDCNSGKELWRWTNNSKSKFRSPGNVIPRIANGRVMIVAPDRVMTHIDLETGKTIWRSKSRKVRESTGISADGNIFYAKTMDGEMVAVPMSADNYTEQWCVNVGWGYDHSCCPLTVDNGIVYMANRSGKVAAVTTEGKIVAVGKFANSAANELTSHNGDIWVSFIEGTIWHLSTSK